MALALALLGGCPADEGGEENVFPTDSAPATTTGMSTTTTTGTTTTTPGTGSITSTTSAMTDDATDTSVADVPRTYRFDCMDIQGVGDADATAIQAQVLENTWRADIDAIKINILFEVLEENLATGEGAVTIRSGVGMDPNALCAEATTESQVFPLEVVDGEQRWVPTGTSGQCSVPGGGDGGRTYVLDLGRDDLVYIYSADDNTVEFNCTPDATPNAVPLRGVSAEVSVDAALQTVAGTMTGCLTLSEGSRLCSCLGQCAATGPDDLQTEGECAGCPTGGVPLTVLLGGVGPSEPCTELTGEPAFDLVIGFSAQRLPAVPMTCGA